MPSEIPSPVRLVQAPQMWEVHLERTDAEAVPAGESGALAFELGFLRGPDNDVGVQLTVTVRDVPGAIISAAFRATFRLETTEGEADVETRMKMVAGHVAPSVIYPYIREAISTVAQRAGLRSVTLPIINFSTFFSLDEIDFPPAPTEAPSEQVTISGKA